MLASGKVCSCLAWMRLSLVWGRNWCIGWGRLVGTKPWTGLTLAVLWALMRIRNVRFGQLGVVARLKAVLVNG